MVRVGHLLEQDLCGGAVAGVCGGDHHPQQQAEGVDHDVPLAALILSHRDEDGLDQGRCAVDSVLDAGCWGLLRLRKVPRPACRSLLMVSWTMSRLSF